MAPGPLEENPEIPLSPESEAKTPIPNKSGQMGHAPSDSMVSISLTESDDKSPISFIESDVSSKEVVEEVLKRASQYSPIDSLNNVEDIVLDSPRSEDRLVMEVASQKARSRSGSLAVITEAHGRERSSSAGSDSSVQVDWETLDKTEQVQHHDTESDEQTTLLLARLEQENDAIATNPKSGIKTRGHGQSRPPSVYQLQKLVQEQGAQSVRYSLLPAAAPMTELDFWAALVRDYPQTAQRLPTVTSNKIRYGIPAPLRGVVWLSMAGARDKEIEERYDKLCAESSPYEKMIGKDVGRSFPQHDMFRDPDGEGQKMLGRVLKCYSLYDEKIGYCQGLGFLVGPLLMNMGDREAFCILVRLMEDYDLRSCFLPDLSGLHLRIYQFNELLRQHVPKVANHLESLGFEGEYLSQWFLSFFAVTCPLPLLFRIYDVVFAEGASETLMRVALAIMQRNEKKILAFAEFEDIMQLLISRQLWDVYGLKPECADEFVHDFVAFTPLVTRESLNSLEASYRDFIQRRTGGRPSILPNVSSAASRFLGRLWSSNSKQQSLSPSNAVQGTSRPTSTLLRTPSKQSLSTVSSVEGIAESTGSTASTLLTDLSASRESSVDNGIFNTTKSTDFGALRRVQTQSKEKEYDNQIEDLLKILSEMQKNQALLNAQLQKMTEDRREDAIAVGAFVDQIKRDVAANSLLKPSHRRTNSDAPRTVAVPSAPKLSSTSLRLLESLESRLSSNHSRRSSGVETKADLRNNISTMREQLHVETTRSQELARELDVKEQESSSLREHLREARVRIKDSLAEKQRLEKTIQDLRQNQRQPLKRSDSKSADDSDGDGARTGLRELRLGRGITRTNSGTPTQVWSKRTSSLMLNPTASSLATMDMPPPSPTRPRHAATISAPVAPTIQHSETDPLLLELANAKTSEAVARQELEELRAKFDALRRLMNMPTSSPSPTPPISIPETPIMQAPNLKLETSTAANMPSNSAPSGIVSAGTFSGLFGWGSKR